MYKAKLTELLNQVRNGKVSPEDAVQRLQNLPYEDLGFARVDRHRALRRGFPEVVFCQNKTRKQILGIIAALAPDQDVLATRVAPETATAILTQYPSAVHNETAATVLLRTASSETPKVADGLILICSAGTSDIPVAEEAAVTAEAMCNRVERLYDVGVAGLHRLLDQRDKLQRAAVLIVVAGMDGALPTVVSGLVDKPLIAVPTSVGYGAGFQGVGPLLTMMNACSPGVVVVNIDNGFGAGYFASLINRG